MKFSGKVSNGPLNKWLILVAMVAIRIRDPDSDPYGDTGKTWLGGGMLCPSACLVVSFNRLRASLITVQVYGRVAKTL